MSAEIKPRDPRRIIFGQNQLPEDLKKLPRVTSILKNIDQPELNAWKLRVGVTEARRVSKESSQRGNVIHRAACFYAKRGFAGISKIEDLTVRHIIKALRNWVEEHVSTFHAYEKKVFNTYNGYRGTMDGLFTMRKGFLEDDRFVEGRRKLVVDYKTGKNIYDDHRMQIGAYRHSDDLVLDPNVGGGCILHLEQDNMGMPIWRTEYIPDVDLYEHFKAFVGILGYHNYKNWRRRQKLIYTGDDFPEISE